MTPIFESALLIYSEDNILSYRMVKIRFFVLFCFDKLFFLHKPYRFDIIDNQKMFTFFSSLEMKLKLQVASKKGNTEFGKHYQSI